jgi:hypothetical protein
VRKGYRITFESFDLDNPGVTLNKSLLMEDEITKPTNCLDFSLSHERQMGLIQEALDKIIHEKASLINEDLKSCPKCSSRFTKKGTHISVFSDIFTDHEVSMRRLRCSKCSYEPPSTVRTFLGTTMSGRLAEMQSVLGAKHTFREGEELFDMFSAKLRRINNHNRIKLVTEEVGKTLQTVNRVEKKIAQIEDAEELILNIDGGHVKSKDADTRSFEVMTSVIYRPESLQTNSKDTRNHLSSKSCTASAYNDNQSEMIEDTIIAAIKEGLTPKTHITALCDGAQNCWNIAEALRPLCESMTSILDWFHLSMKIENILLQEELKSKFLRIKWHLWRGNTDAAIIRLGQLISKAKDDNVVNKLNKFLKYIQNNQDKIVNYRERDKRGLVFTSNLAESTVESLINQRCKGKQHMRWSREGLNPILQLRAAISSKDWDNKWRTVILNCSK